MSAPGASPSPPAPGAESLLLGVFALVAAGLAAAMALGPLEGIAHLPEEVAGTLQARLFAALMRSGPPADEPELMEFPLWLAAPRSLALLPPGGPLLLGLGQLLGAVWLGPALLAAALPPLHHALARALHRPLEEARLAALIAALSPGLALLAGSRLPQTALTAPLLALLLLRLRPAPHHPLAAGLAHAGLLLVDPLLGLLIGLPLLLSPWRALASHERRWLLLPSLLALGALLLDLLRFGSAWWPALLGPFARLAAGVVPIGSGGPWTALSTLDRQLLGLPGGLLLAGVGLARLPDRGRLLALALPVLGLGLFAPTEPGPFAARSLHALYALLPVLAAAGLGALPARLRGLSPALVLVAALWGLGRETGELLRGPGCVDGRVAARLRQEGIDQGLVFYLATPAEAGPLAACDPRTTAGALWQLADPTRTQGGLQVRHALPEVQGLRLYMQARHPGARAWLLWHDLQRDTIKLREVLMPPDLGEGQPPAP